MINRKGYADSEATSSDDEDAQRHQDAKSQRHQDAIVEIQECRACLKPGRAWHCCDAHFCIECYYKAHECPACNAPVAPRGFDTFAVTDPEPKVMCGGFTCACLLISGLVSGLLIALVHYVTLPTTLHGHSCAGFFPTCHLPRFCIEHDGVDFAVPFAETGTRGWTRCNFKSKYKIRGSMCITDTSVYARTRGELGYDLCADGFYAGILIFEDTFENPSVSSNWADLRNGRRESFCGALHHELESDPLFQSQSTQIGYNTYLKDWEDTNGHALVFMNEPVRQAVTPPLNVLAGAEVMFGFKYGYGVGEDGTGKYPKCKRINDGFVQFEYSIDNGKTWFILKTFRQVPYQDRFFTPVRIKLPLKALSKRTILRWRQPLFYANSEYWALEDVRVYRFLPSGWQEADAWLTRKRENNQYLQKAQCCLDSYACPPELRQDRIKWQAECNGTIWKENRRKWNNDYLAENLKGREMLLVIAFMIWLMQYAAKMSLYFIVRHFTFPVAGLVLYDLWQLCKRIFLLAKAYVKNECLSRRKKRRKKKTKMQPQVIQVDTVNRSPRCRFDGSFTLRGDAIWRTLYIVFTAGALTTVLTVNYESILARPNWRLSFALLGQRVLDITLPYSLLLCGAIWLDMKDIYITLRWTISMASCLMPKIEIKALANVMEISQFPRKEIIHMTDVKEMIKISQASARWMGLSYVIGNLPWATMILLISDRSAAVCVGTVVIWKAIYGNAWLLKTVWMGKYIFLSVFVCNSDLDDYRSEFAGALYDAREHNTTVGCIWMCTVMPVALFTLVYFQLDMVGKVFMPVILAAFSYGILVGVSNKLPVHPTLLLTTLEMGLQIRYTRKPDLHGANHAWWKNVLQQESVLICFVDGELDFHDLVRGTPPEDGGPGVDTEFLEDKKKKKEATKENLDAGIDANEEESLDEIINDEGDDIFGLQAQELDHYNYGFDRQNDYLDHSDLSIVDIS